MATKHMTVAEAAELYKVSERTIHRWIKAGSLTVIRPGGRTVRIVINDTTGDQQR